MLFPSLIIECFFCFFFVFFLSENVLSFARRGVTVTVAVPAPAVAVAFGGNDVLVVLI